MSKKAVILLSGGLDSATILYEAMRRGYKPRCLIFSYGQRHHREVRHAKRIAAKAGCPFRLVKIALGWQGSSLLDCSLRLPTRRSIDPGKIPSTYVPARNIIFLSFAASYAEAIGASAVFIGANAIDYSGYPDCRPRFFKAYENLMKLGMKAGVEGKPIRIVAPLLHKTKAQIIRRGMRFEEAGVKDS
jgi:7-cyano-7-deazaguanine synthase